MIKLIIKDNILERVLPNDIKKGHIDIVDGIVGIKDNAFNFCANLKSVYLPSTLTDIGNYAFNDCKSLTSIIIPNSVTSLGEYAFAGCKSLDTVLLGDNIAELKQGTFENCTNLKNITIRDNVQSIDINAFKNCNNLTIHCTDEIAKKFTAAFEGHNIVLSQAPTKNQDNAIDTVVQDTNENTVANSTQKNENFIETSSSDIESEQKASSENSAIDSVSESVNKSNVEEKTELPHIDNEINNQNAQNTTAHKSQSSNSPSSDEKTSETPTAPNDEKSPKEKPRTNVTYQAKTTYIAALPENKPQKLRDCDGFWNKCVNIKDKILYALAKVVNTVITGAAKVMLGPQGLEEEIKKQERVEQRRIIEAAERQKPNSKQKENVRESKVFDKEVAHNNPLTTPEQEQRPHDFLNKKLVQEFNKYLQSSITQINPEIVATANVQSLLTDQGQRNIMQVHLIKHGNAVIDKDNVVISPMGNIVGDLTDNSIFVSAAYCAYLSNSQYLMPIKAAIQEDVNNAISEFEKRPNEPISFLYNDIATQVTPNSDGTFTISTSIEPNKQETICTECVKEDIATVVSSHIVTGIETKAEIFERTIFEIETPSQEDIGQPQNTPHDDLYLGPETLEEPHFKKFDGVSYEQEEVLDELEDAAFDRDAGFRE